MRFLGILVILISICMNTKAFAKESALIANLPNDVNALEDLATEEFAEVLLVESDPYKDVFPKGYEQAYDPINKKKYQKAVIGRVFKSVNPFNGYDYYRYKTVYNKKELLERMTNLPYHYEACHEDNYEIANWEEARTITVSVEAGVSFEYLGFGASVKSSIEYGVTLKTSRSIKATLGIEAKHYPYQASEELSGVTYIQTYSKGGEVQYLLPDWSDAGLYPYNFFLDNQNVGFIVKREIMKKCPEYDNVIKTSEANRF